jgi:hypothetical protein
MMTSRPTADYSAEYHKANGVVYGRHPGADSNDHKMPADPGVTDFYHPSPLVDMPRPRILSETGDNLAEGEATVNSTANSVLAAEGWPRLPHGGTEIGNEPRTEETGPVQHRLHGGDTHLTSAGGIGTGGTAPVPPWTGVSSHPAMRQ